MNDVASIVDPAGKGLSRIDPENSKYIMERSI